MQAPEFADPDKTLLARQVFFIVRAFIVSSVFLQAVQIALAPRVTGRWLALLLGTVTASLALLVMNRRGHVRAASLLLVASLWLLIGIFSWTQSGLGTRAAYGYFIVTFIAGMVLGKWPGIVTAVVCSASTLLIALEAPFPSSDPLRFWVINSLFLIIVLLLQDLAGRSIRTAMAEALAELRERQQAQAALARSEERHREMVNSLPVGVFETDLNGRVRFVNQTVLDWFGYAPADVAAGLDVFQIFEGSDGERARENARRLLSGETTATREYSVRRKDGSAFTALIRTRVMVQDGAAVGLQGSLIDISDRKLADREREKVISLLRATVESTADGILVVDTAGKIAHFNQRFKEIWRIPDSVLADGVDETALAFVLDQLVDAEGFLAKVQQLYATPLAESFDLLEFKDGRAFERYSRPQMLNGAPIGRVWSFRDVSERRRIEGERWEMLSRFHGFADSSQYGMGMADLAGRIVYANPTLVRMLGEKTAANCLGKHFPSAYYPRPMARKLQEEVLPAIMRDGHWHGELELLTADGRSLPTDENYFLIRDEHGRPSFLADILTDISERKRAEQMLQDSERRYRAVFESAGDAILLSRGREFVDCNEKLLELFGCQREDLAALSPGFLSPEKQPDGRNSQEKAMEKVKAALDGQLVRFDWIHLRKDGTPFPAEVTLNRVELKDGTHLLAVIRDVSDRRKLEQQLLQAQKMEAVGILAGGVAHDFNNILSTIVGYGSLLQMRIHADPQLRDYIERILDSCERAVRLTSSLLTFSRKQEIDLQAIDINDAIFSFHKILARLIGEDIDFRIDLASQPLVADADARQVEQLLMNLATNSRDAMPDGGRLTISTAAVVFDRDAGGIPRGSYAAIAVADSGSGMDQDVQAHAFEPFYTTKEIGKGTGLGLAIVYGIVKRHGGYITLASAPGKGATFTIYLPLKSPLKKGERRGKPERIPSGSETILLIEDDPSVRQVTRSILEEFGYSVLEAEDGEMGLEVFRRHPQRIHLVLCDLIMPKLNGRETLAAIQKIRPGTKAIFMSGYASDVIAGKGIAASGAFLLLKPLNPSVLLKKVRAVLDERKGTAP